MINDPKCKKARKAIRLALDQFGERYPAISDDPENTNTRIAIMCVLIDAVDAGLITLTIRKPRVEPSVGQIAGAAMRRKYN